MILFILSIVFQVNASDVTCPKDGKITWIENKKSKVSKESYCYNKETGFLIKKSCMGNDECLAWSTKGRVVPKDAFTGSFGNPVFRVCRFVGGTPEIIRVWDGEKFKKSSWCKFKDGSYIDNDTLYSNQKVQN